MTSINGTLHRITSAELLPSAIGYRQRGWRLVQICAVTVENGYELSYSFAMNYDMETLRVCVATEDEVTSISEVYGAAFLYENEIRELFGVHITHISTDFHDRLYRIHTKTPFAGKGERRILRWPEV